jgi:hypothetical protein
LTAAEDDYRRGFHDGESGRPEKTGSDSYAAGWRVGSRFALDTAEPPEPALPPARTADIADVLAEIPKRLWTPSTRS